MNVSGVLRCIMSVNIMAIYMTSIYIPMSAHIITHANGSVLACEGVILVPPSPNVGYLVFHFLFYHGI